MVITAKEYLEHCDVNSYNTVYGEEPIEILEYPMILEDFLSFENRGKEHENFIISTKIRDRLEEIKRKDKRMIALHKQLNGIDLFIKILKETKSHTLMEQLIDSRKNRKILLSLLENREREIEKNCMYHDFQRKEAISKNLIWYKKTAYLTTIRNLAAKIHEFANIELKQLIQAPIFVSGMEGLEKAVKENKKFGIEGGPCLLGYDEVYIKVTHSDGKTVEFDFSGPKYNEDNNEKLEDHTIQNVGNIESITFDNRKKQITRSDLLGLIYVFELAKAFEGKAVIPIVDMSYRKYISKICENLKDEIRHKAEEEFRKIIYEIGDIYLLWIEAIKLIYPQVEVVVLQERDKESLDLYYKKRDKYLLNYKKLRAITNNESRRNSIIDYVTMPALPYYIWGIKDLIQVDSISEIDSYRRCRLIHGKDINLYGFFYIEEFSMDKLHSDSTAKFADKNYICQEAFDLSEYKTL